MQDAPPLTIAQLDAESDFSGGEVQVFLLLEGLRRRGHRGVLVCPPGSRAEAEARDRGLPTVSLRMRNHLALGTVGRIRRVLDEIGADVVHTNTGRDAWLGGFAAWRAGRVAITTRRMDRRVKRGLRTRLTYERFARRVVAISPGVRTCLEAAGVPSDRIVLIPEAFDPERIAPRRGREATRAALGAKVGDVVLLSLGALVRRKGYDVLLEAVAALPPELGRRAVVAIAGEGKERARLERRAAGCGSGTRIRFLGDRADVGDLLAAADLFAMPSRAEGLGVAALEAMGAGRPVVASRVGGLAFSVEDGTSGLLVPPDDPRRLAEALARAIGDPKLRTHLARGAEARARERFGPERMVDAYVSLYREVLAESPAPARV